MIKIIDDFFPNPYEIRNEGIKCNNFKKGIIHPGNRHVVSEKTQSYILKKLKTELNLNLNMVQSGFDFITKEYVTGIPHFDKSKHNGKYFCDYSAVVYLHPNPKPNSGIEIYDKSEKYKNLFFYTKNAEQLKEGFFCSSKNQFDRFIWKNLIIPRTLRGLKNDKIEVSNKFNRMIVFDSNFVHRPQNYFGDKKENCRLSIISFLNLC